jgi:hypothetical protein
MRTTPFRWPSCSETATNAISREARLLLEQLFDDRPSGLIAVAGDFNAEDHEVPLNLIVAADENTGKSAPGAAFAGGS